MKTSRISRILALFIILAILISGAIIYYWNLDRNESDITSRGFELFSMKLYDLSEREIEMLVARATQDELEDVVCRLDEIESAQMLIELPDETWPTEKRVSVSIELIDGKELEADKLQKIIQLISYSTNVPKENITIIDKNTGGVIKEK